MWYVSCICCVGFKIPGKSDKCPGFLCVKSWDTIMAPPVKPVALFKFSK